VADQPSRLCIISRNQLLCGDFVTALRASLSPEDRLDIIIDRRHPESSGAPDFGVERRQLSEVDLALEAEGFAIVPMSDDRVNDAISLSRLPAETPIEHRSKDEDDGLLERVKNFLRRPPDAVIRTLGILTGLAVTAIVLSVAAWITGPGLISQPFTPTLWGGSNEPAGQASNSFAAAQSSPAASETPVAAETPEESTPSPSPARRDDESIRASAASDNSVAPRDGDRRTLRQRPTSGPSDATDTARREHQATPHDAVQRIEKESTPRVASPLSDETGAPLKADADQSAIAGRPRVSAKARPDSRTSAPSKQVASAPSAQAATPEATSTRSESPYRAELVGEPVSRGWGNSYIVRLVNSAGQPMKVLGVLLVARMADGSAENVAMGALPEPGMYRGTVPIVRSTPVDLRVRVSVDDKFVEVPLTP